MADKSLFAGCLHSRHSASRMFGNCQTWKHNKENNVFITDLQDCRPESQTQIPWLPLPPHLHLTSPLHCPAKRCMACHALTLAETYLSVFCALRRNRFQLLLFTTLFFRFLKRIQSTDKSFIVIFRPLWSDHQTINLYGKIKSSA